MDDQEAAAEAQGWTPSPCGRESSSSGREDCRPVAAERVRRGQRASVQSGGQVSDCLLLPEYLGGSCHPQKMETDNRGGGGRGGGGAVRVTQEPEAVVAPVEWPDERPRCGSGK